MWRIFRRGCKMYAHGVQSRGQFQENGTNGKVRLRPRVIPCCNCTMTQQQTLPQGAHISGSGRSVGSKDDLYLNGAQPWTNFSRDEVTLQNTHVWMGQGMEPNASSVVKLKDAYSWSCIYLANFSREVCTAF
jgi:hypothetical protein